MSYEPSTHQAQMSILRHLLFRTQSSFNELLKETDLASDHFTFHVKKLIDAGYVVKDNARYQLSREGKEYANRMDTDEKVIEKQPKVSVLLFVKNNEEKFLSQQRLKQPFYGFWGRMSGNVCWGETLEEAADRELQEETGLTTIFVMPGCITRWIISTTGCSWRINISS